MTRVGGDVRGVAGPWPQEGAPAALPERPLDVVVVTTRFPAPAETFASSRVRSLLEAGHRVRVMSYKPPDPGWEGLVAERRLEAAELLANGPGETVSGLAASLFRPAVLARSLAWLARTCAKEPVHLARALAALPFAFRALELLELDTPDVVHLEWGHYPAVLVPLLRWRGLPCVVSLSLVAYDIYRGFPGTRTAAALADVVRTQARCNVPEIVAATGLEPSRVELVPDGVDTARIAAVARRTAKVPGRVAVVSRLVPAKGVDDALRAFAAARRTNPHATLRVMGTGPAEDALRRLAAELGVDDAVAFLGHVAHDRVLEELAASEALLHLSHMERLPNAVKEAMACGCVAITTRTFGIEELVRDRETGYLVEVHDHAAAGASLARVLARPEAHAAMRAAAASLVGETMDHAASVRRLVDLWRRALDARGAGGRGDRRHASHGAVTR
jgi:glycosyltransferase involved in cell wall biosynthesis